MSRLDFIIKKKNIFKKSKRKLNKSLAFEMLEDIYNYTQKGYLLEVMADLTTGDTIFECWKPEDDLVYDYRLPVKALEYITGDKFETIKDEWSNMQVANHKFFIKLHTLMKAKSKDFMKLNVKFSKTQTQKDINPR